MTIAAQLDQIFRETLSIEPPPADTDLIATGVLDSLSVVTLLVELEQHFGVTVRLEEIDLESLRTLDRLVGLIEDARHVHPPPPDREDEHQPVVALRPGTGGRPLFIVHMVGGGIAMLRRLAAELDTQRPVYGLQARGLEPTQEPRRTVEEMAEAYTDAIRVVQPEGPYALCGYSFGGLVAFEMACQLSALGQELDFLALIDPEAHPAALPRGARWRFRAALPFRLLGHVATHPGTTAAEYTRRAVSRLSPRPGPRLGQGLGAAVTAPHHEHPIGAQYVRVVDAAQTAASVYRPGFYRGRAALFLADQGRRIGACNPALVWRYHVLGEITIEPVSGRHADLFARENIGTVASAVSARLRASQSVGPGQPSAK